MAGYAMMRFRDSELRAATFQLIAITGLFAIAFAFVLVFDLTERVRLYRSGPSRAVTVPIRTPRRDRISCKGSSPNAERTRLLLHQRGQQANPQTRLSQQQRVPYRPRHSSG